MSIDIAALKIRWERQIWETDPQQVRWSHKIVLYSLRLLIAVFRDITDGQLTLRAMSLVYTTLLSIVPLLALSFSVLKALGAHQQVTPFLLEALSPLGEQRHSVVNQIIGFVDNMKVGVLGSLGLGVLIYTVISLVQKIERAFNFIWHVSDLRPMSERFSSYLSVILIGPVLVVAAAGITASVASSTIMLYLSSVEPIGWFIRSIGPMIPWLLVALTFALVYIFIPNTKVKLSAGLIGAAVASILWKGTSLLFSTFVVESTKTEAIYSGFAIVIFLMMWTYLSWMILLVGSNISYYVQHTEQMHRRREALKLSARMHEMLATMVMYLSAKQFAKGEPGPSMQDFMQHCKVYGDAIEIAIESLMAARLLRTSQEDPVRYFPGKDIHQITVADILRSARSANENRYLNLAQVKWPESVKAVEQDIKTAIDNQFGERSLMDLINNDTKNN